MGSNVPPITPRRSRRPVSSKGFAAEMLVAQPLVLGRVLAVRIRVFIYGVVTVAEVRVGNSDEHQDQQNAEDGHAEHHWRSPQRCRRFSPAFAPLSENRYGDLLKLHFLP